MRKSVFAGALVATAALAAPALSTVRLPLQEIGRRGFAFAERLLAGEQPESEVLPSEVVMRESTGAPSAAALPGARIARPTRARPTRAGAA